jgi:hypothetical protein
MKRSRATPQDRHAVSQSERPAPPEPSRDAIAQRAYELYRARGRTDGRDLDDWLQAEQELRNRGQSD